MEIAGPFLFASADADSLSRSRMNASCGCHDEIRSVTLAELSRRISNTFQLAAPCLLGTWHACGVAMRKVTFVLAVLLLWTAKPAEATFIYTYELRCTNPFGCSEVAPFSFSILSELVTGIGQTSLGDPNLVSLTPPPGCQSFTNFTVVSYQRFPTEGERIEGFARCNLAIWGILTVFDEQFDHVGTYTKGNATLTIAEVPDLGSTALIFTLGIAALGLRRRTRKPLHHGI